MSTSDTETPTGQEAEKLIEAIVRQAVKDAEANT